MTTRVKIFSVTVNFMKPVFEFNSSCLSIRGGHLQSFHEISGSIYSVEIKANNEVISISVPENVTVNIAGNKNLASSVQQVKHYSVTMISSAISTFAIASFTATSLAVGFLTVSTASLLSEGILMRPSSSLTSNPTRYIFEKYFCMINWILHRIACHIQIFALSRWLAVMLPVEYYEFARGLQWSIPYFNLPWEAGHNHPYLSGSSSLTGSNPYLTKPQADNIFEARTCSQWKDFYRSMFWLAIFSAGLIFLQVFLLVMKLRKTIYETQGSYGALTFPRFEIFLTFFALPSLSMASGALFRGEGL